MKRDRYQEQFDFCANCGKIKAAHRIGDDKCPRISKKGYNVSFDKTTTTFSKIAGKRPHTMVRDDL